MQQQLVEETLHQMVGQQLQQEGFVGTQQEHQLYLIAKQLMEVAQVLLQVL